MSIKELQDYTYYAKYARYNKNAKRRETWFEAVDRVKQMHLKKYPQVANEIEWAFEQVKQRRVLGSQRALQYGGLPIEKKNARLYNCTVSFCDRVKFFQEALWLLLCGCGVGFSVQHHHVEKLPKFSAKNGENKTYQIPDSIEGWSDALGVLLASYMKHPELLEWEGTNVSFDYSLIRPAGAELSSGAGKAPGHEPLKKALDLIRYLLDERISQGFDRLRPIDAYDIVMHASDAVISGGVRRSATICIFSPDDKEMAAAKTGNWFNENPQRGRSNNSAMLVRSETSRDDFMNLMKFVKDCGEPGFYWSDSTEQLPNPCFHRDTLILTEDGYHKVGDLYAAGKSLKIVADNRPGKDNELDINRLGVSIKDASDVKLTQKNASIYEVTTSHGHTIKVTDSHEFPTMRGRLKLRDMVEGDVILLQSDEGAFGSFGTFNQGMLLGLMTGDGCFSNEEAWIDVWESDFDTCDLIKNIVNREIESLPSISNGDRLYGEVDWQDQASGDVAKKRIGGRRLYRFFKEALGIDNPSTIKDRVPSLIWSGSRDFVRGYIQGLVATDGSVQMTGHAKKTTLSLRISQSNKLLLQDIQIILNNFGIVSRLYSRRPAGMRLLPDCQGGQREYLCKEAFELILSRPNCITFKERIGLFGRKALLLNSFLNIRGETLRKPERYITTVSSIKYWGQDDVYCLTQYDTNTVIANGCVVGQCVEIGMWPVHEKTRESGWQFCNLCEINGKKVKSKEDFEIAAKAAAIIGTLQAGYTSFDYLGKTTEEIVRREALLGVSMTGMMDNPDIIFDPKIQREMAQLVVKTNEEMAKKIGINAAARTTCVKPAGTTSCILGSSSGIHPHHARRYFRRVQANFMESTLLHFKKVNPTAVEKSVWNANGTDEVITFCVEVPDGAKTKNDLSAVDLLKQVRSTFMNWVTPGKVTERCVQPWLSHNVSNTINVRENEWDEVAEFIYENRDSFAGVSLLPQSGDLDYPQAPFCNVLTSKEILAEYGEGALFASGLIVDGLHAFADNLWEACDTALGRGKENPEAIIKALVNRKDLSSVESDKLQLAIKQIDWIRRVHQFAERYCDNDVIKCCRLMKHVNNWKVWLDLNRNYKNVDWTVLFEEKDTTANVTAEPACAGGSCELPADWLTKKS